jgi:TonB family protein
MRKSDPLPAPGYWLSQRYRRPIVLGLVLVLHVLVIWTIAESLPVVRLGNEARVTQVYLLRPLPGSPQPDPAIILPTFTQPQPVGVSEPTIEIAEDPQPISSTLTALDLSQLLPPRPDSRHINVAPILPVQFRSLRSAVTAMLTIYVEPDGSISAAQVVRSSGTPALDAWAVSYVEANWRFFPASVRGRPVADWTTIVVRFNAT